MPLLLFLVFLASLAPCSAQQVISAPPASNQQAALQEQAFVKALWEEAPACAAAWNAWIKGIGADTRIFDFQDAKRFQAAKKACEKALRNLERNGYGQAGKSRSK